MRPAVPQPRASDRPVAQPLRRAVTLRQRDDRRDQDTFVEYGAGVEDDDEEARRARSNDLLSDICGGPRDYDENHFRQHDVTPIVHSMPEQEESPQCPIITEADLHVRCPHKVGIQWMRPAVPQPRASDRPVAQPVRRAVTLRQRDDRRDQDTCVEYGAGVEDDNEETRSNDLLSDKCGGPRDYDEIHFRQHDVTPIVHIMPEQEESPQCPIITEADLHVRCPHKVGIQWAACLTGGRGKQGADFEDPHKGRKDRRWPFEVASGWDMTAQLEELGCGAEESQLHCAQSSSASGSDEEMTPSLRCSSDKPVVSNTSTNAMGNQTRMLQKPKPPHGFKLPPLFEPVDSPSREMQADKACVQ